MLQSIALSCRQQLRTGFRRVRPDDDEVNVDALERAWDRGRKRWPDLELDPETFAAAVAERLDADVSLDDALERLHIEDLYLVVCCVEGSDPALAAFDAGYLRPVVAALAVADGDRDEVAQRMRTSLLVRAGNEPRLRTYRARGPLKRWIRVGALRAALAIRPRRTDDEALGALVDPGGDPELLYLRELYSDELRQTLTDAFDALDRRSRSLLRHSLVDRLTVDQIARIYHVPRATAGRHVLQARQQLVETTRARLKARFDWSSRQLQSVLRMIESNADLGEGGLPPKEKNRPPTHRDH